MGFVLIEAIVLSLGFWQLHRLTWKQDLLAQQAHLQSPDAPAAPLTAAMLDTQTKTEQNSTGGVQKVRIEGLRWLPHLFAVHPKTRDGHAGAELFAPLELQDHRVLWVNLGWTPLMRASAGRAYRNTGPTLSAEALKDLPPTFDGVLRTPHLPGWFVPKNAPEKNRWLSFDAQAMAQAAGLERTAGYVERLGPPLQLQDHKVLAVAIRALRNDHLGYAITWFALAIALVVFVATQSPRPTFLRRRR